MDPELHIVTLTRGGSSWKFSWKPGDEESLVQYVVKCARENFDGFDWFDATLVVQQIAAKSNKRIKLPKKD